MKTLKCIIGSSILVLIGLQFYIFDGFEKEYFSGLAANLLTEIIGIAITIWIVEKLIAEHKRKQDLITIQYVLKNQYLNLVTLLGTRYINFVTKKPFSYPGEPQIYHLKNQLYAVVANINNYVKSDFIGPVQALILNPNRIFDSVEKEVSYDEFCRTMFKIPLNQAITEFLNRYIAILPDDIRNCVFKISDLLKSDYLLTPSDLGLGVNFNGAKINVEEFRRVLRSLGEEIERLLKYC